MVICPLLRSRAVVVTVLSNGRNKRKTYPPVVVVWPISGRKSKMSYPRINSIIGFFLAAERQGETSARHRSKFVGRCGAGVAASGLLSPFRANGTGQDVSVAGLESGLRRGPAAGYYRAGRSRECVRGDCCNNKIIILPSRVTYYTAATTTMACCWYNTILWYNSALL